ncbi:MAG: flippase-like domain-containing protein [bacterium]|nr:flippase-like domain-containing protein [bacterium]
MPDQTSGKTGSNKISIFLSVIIFIAFVLWFGIEFGWGEVLRLFSNFSPARLAGLMVLVFISYILRTVRIYDYMKSKLKGGFLLTTRLVLLHNFFNNLLPMRTGEAAFPLLMKRYFAVNITESISVLFWLRFLDLHFLSVAAYIILFSDFYTSVPGNILLLALILLPAGIYAFRRKLTPLADADGSFIKRNLTKLASGLPDSVSRLLRSWLWTVMNWSLKLTAYAFILVTVIDIKFSSAVFASIIGDLSSILPIHGFAGTATYEGGVVLGLKYFQIPLETALNAAVVLHIFFLACSFIGACIGYLIYSKNKLLKADKNNTVPEIAGTGSQSAE